MQSPEVKIGRQDSCAPGLPPWRQYLSAVVIAALPVLALNDWSKGIAPVDSGLLLLLVVPFSPIIYILLSFPSLEPCYGQYFFWIADGITWFICIFAIYSGLVWASRRSRMRRLATFGVILAWIAAYGIFFLIFKAVFNRMLSSIWS